MSRLIEVDGYNARGIAYLSVAGNRVNDVAGNWYSWNGTFQGGDSKDFTQANGVLTYTGSKTTDFTVYYSGIHRGSGTGTPAWVNVGVSVNDAIPAADTVRSIKGSSTATGQSLMATIILKNGDNVRIKSEAPAGADGTTTIYWDLNCAMTVIEN